MTQTLLIRPAAPEDMTTILALIDDASAWLRSKGTDQWAKPWPDETKRNDRVWQGICGGDTWIVEDDAQPVATVTYRDKGNQKLWTAAEREDPAVYVSRLIVSRRRAGCGIGAALIDWAGLRAVRKWQPQWIRIDVWTTNIALHNYYKERQFRSVRVCEFEDMEDYPSAALFQKPAAEIDEEAAARFTVVDEG